MAIQVVCRNGHTVKVKDSLAGKTGLCPVCKVKVTVPANAALGAIGANPPSEAPLSEDAILDLLGPHEQDASRKYEPLEEETPAQAGAPINLDPGAVPRMTSCDRCHQVIPVGTHICPHCRTFIAGLKDLK